MEAPRRKPYPSDVSDDEWGFVAPYLTLMTEHAPQRSHELREVFNGLPYIVKTGAPWRWMPNDLPPWEAVYQQSQRWLRAGCFAVIVHDLRALLRLAAGRPPEPTAVIFDGRMLQSTPESGPHAGYDGYKRRKGTKPHTAVDTLGHLLALLVTPAAVQERQQVEQLAAAVQAATGESVELAYVDQGYTGDDAADAAETHGIRLEVVKHAKAKRLHPAVASVGSRTLVRLGGTLPPARSWLRAPARDLGRTPLRRLRLPHAHPSVPRPRSAPSAQQPLT
jgi:transposase